MLLEFKPIENFPDFSNFFTSDAIFLANKNKQQGCRQFREALSFFDDCSSSFAILVSGNSGAVIEAKRSATFPLRPTRSFSKFRLIFAPRCRSSIQPWLSAFLGNRLTGRVFVIHTCTLFYSAPAG